MKRTKEILPIGLLMIFVGALFAGPAAAAIISNGDFEQCERRRTDDDPKRIQTGGGMKARELNPGKVMLYDGAVGRNLW